MRRCTGGSRPDRQPLQHDYAEALLTSYNVAFVLPLDMLVAVSSSQPVLQKVSRLHITHRGLVKLALGVLAIATGLFALL